MSKIEDVIRWLRENEAEVDFGEIHVVIRKHQGQISEVKKAMVQKGKTQKKSGSKNI